MTRLRHGSLFSASAMLVDTHCHLTSDRFEEGEIPHLLKRAADAGVERLITIGTDLADSAASWQLARQYSDQVSATVGIHPCSVHEIGDELWLEQLETWLREPEVVALGEIGLDHHHPPPEGFDTLAWRGLQAERYRQQLELAAETDTPVVIHQRDCFEAVVEATRPFAGRVRGVFHCFTGEPEEAALLLDLGFLVSFTGVVTFKNARSVQATARELPSDRFMVETDAPYLAPVPHRGKRCEPAFVADTARFVSELRREPLEQTLAATGSVARQLFNF